MKYNKKITSKEIKSFIKDLKNCGITDIYFDQNKFRIYIYNGSSYSELINNYVMSFSNLQDIEIKY